ncbi:MAG: alpha/beta fold hydrolase [Armatimonadota bacterium]|nr:alpha/beta fold hydrolase [Armatimonadota bacterium]
MADRFIEIAGARVRYRVEGTGPAVVLVHGLGAFIESWAWTIPALRDRYTTIAFDFPGFGQSSPLDAAFSPEGAASFVASFMDALEVRRAALIGSSLGGTIATLVAGRTPGRCTALVLAAPAGFGPHVTLATRLATLPFVGECFVAAIRRAPQVGVRSAFRRREQIPPPILDAARRTFRAGPAGDTCLRIVRSTVTVRGIHPGVIRRVHEAAARVTARTLVVWGTLDRVVPPAHAAIVTRAIPHAETLMIPGASHVPYIEDADTFNTAVREFLIRSERLAGVGTRR